MSDQNDATLEHGEYVRLSAELVAERVQRRTLDVVMCEMRSQNGYLRDRVDVLTAERDQLSRDRELLAETLSLREARAIVAQTTVTFFASVIKSGEGWSPACEAALRAALDSEGSDG